MHVILAVAAVVLLLVGIYCIRRARFEKALWEISPTHQMLQQNYLTHAQAPDYAPGSSEAAIPFWVGGGAAIVVAVVLGVIAFYLW